MSAASVGIVSSHLAKRQRRRYGEFHAGRHAEACRTQCEPLLLTCEPRLLGLCCTAAAHLLVSWWKFKACSARLFNRKTDKGNPLKEGYPLLTIVGPGERHCRQFTQPTTVHVLSPGRTTSCFPQLKARHDLAGFSSTFDRLLFPQFCAWFCRVYIINQSSK